MAAKSDDSFLKSGITLVFLLSILVALYFIHPGQQISDLKIQKFSSVDELKTYLSENSDSGFDFYSYSGLTRNVAMESAKSVDSYAPSAAGSGSSLDFSQTNNQVFGVDEADTIKNDGSYIYKITSNNVSIISAVPANEMKIVSTISIENATPSQIFVSGNRIAVFGSIYYYYQLYGDMKVSAVSGSSGAESDSGITLEEQDSISSIARPYRNTQQSFINIYDISDRSAPTLVANYTIDGNYYDSRMIGNYIYLITNQYVSDYANPMIPEAAYRCGYAGCLDIWYFPGYDTGHQFTVISAVDMQNLAEPNSKVFLTGYSSNLYVSENNVYIVNTKTLSITDFLERYVNKISSLLPGDANAKISAILSSELFSNNEKYSAMQRVIQNYTYSLSEEDMKNFITAMEVKQSEFYNETAKEMEKTIIHKVSVSNGAIEYKSAGEVPGTTLNQFSLDEYNGYLRIATTTNSWETISKNHIYVLDSSMNVAGSLEDMAPGERIYSVRFMGDRAYLVTFRQVDPLFAVDLSNPTAPAVLGELKINGVSDYLHPYDENHIIGVGRDANESGSIKGMKIALFDVSDAQNPVEISKIIIGESGTYSEALYDHKAFLFSKERSLLVIPISTTEYKNSEKPYEYYYEVDTHQAAYVFNIDAENGIVLKGTVTHDNRTNTSGYMDYNRQVSRSLYIGDVLYTASQKEIKANSLGDLSELGKVELPIQYYYPIYY